nr:hypothetical protein [uncultured Campylobacter sp.]
MRYLTKNHILQMPFLKRIQTLALLLSTMKHGFLMQNLKTRLLLKKLILKVKQILQMPFLKRIQTLALLLSTMKHGF